MLGVIGLSGVCKEDDGLYIEGDAKGDAEPHGVSAGKFIGSERESNGDGTPNGDFDITPPYVSTKKTMNLVSIVLLKSVLGTYRHGF